MSEHAHLRVSRQSMNASVAANTQAMTLAQIGMKMPCTVTSHAKATRSNCSNETSEKMTMAKVVKGFNRNLRCVDQSWISHRRKLPGPSHKWSATDEK